MTLDDLVSDVMKKLDLYGFKAIDFKGKLNLKLRTPDALSPRQRELLLLLATGNTNKDVARKWQVSPKTVEAHRYTLYRKFNFHNLADVTYFAFATQLINIPKADCRASVAEGEKQI